MKHFHRNFPMAMGRLWPFSIHLAHLGTHGRHLSGQKVDLRRGDKQMVEIMVKIMDESWWFFFGVSNLEVVYLVGGWLISTPLKKMSSTVGTINPKIWKMFQTSNQIRASRDMTDKMNTSIFSEHIWINKCFTPDRNGFESWGAPSWGNCIFGSMEIVFRCIFGSMRTLRHLACPNRSWSDDSDAVSIESQLLIPVSNLFASMREISEGAKLKTSTITATL